MEDFTPIDHKDSASESRDAVRRGIERLLGSRLTGPISAETLLGNWDRTVPRLANRPAERLCYFADGTFSAPWDTRDSPRGRWSVESGVYTEITWGGPIPEYDIHEGTWNPSTYHCAATETGAVVLWNGDASLLLLLTRPA